MKKKMGLYTPLGLAIMLVLGWGLAVLFPAQMQAQTFYGSVVGTVTDGSGAVVPGATVTIRDVATNGLHTMVTNSEGEYSFVSLVPSTYEVVVQMNGFKRFQRDQVTVEVNATVRIQAALSVGATTETIIVTSATPLIQTDSATLSTVIEGKTVDEMPLNGRNTMNLIALAPGVVPANSTAGGAALGTGGSTQSSSWAAYSIGGGLVGQSTMYLDGMPLNVLGGGGQGAIQFVPTQDAIQEFSVATNADTSEFGRYSGGVVNMTTKSGTNNWHGSAYEYARNRILNANEFFNKQNQLSQGVPNQTAKWNQNQYGVVVGGPVKKDKIFALFSWEAFSARLSSLQTRAVPTSDMLNGIIDNRNVAAAVNALNPNCHAVYNATTGNTQINGGVMSSASGCFDPTALVIMTEWPKANVVSTQNNFQKQSGYGSDTANYIGRVDYQLSQKQRIFARFSEAKLQDISQEWMPGGIMPSGQPWHIGGGATVNRATSGVFGDTYTLNPTTILDARLSVARVYNSQVPTLAGNAAVLSSLGPNWASLAKSETVANIPATNFTDTCQGYVCSPSTFQNAGTLTYGWFDNVALVFGITKLFGPHNLKVGGEVRRMDRSIINMVQNSAVGGTLTFNAQYFTQSAWGNFLLGLPDQAQMATVREVTSINWYQGFYINDTFQATHKLTINAGLRYELPGNIKEKHDAAIELEPGLNDTTSIPGTSIIGTVALVNSAQYADRGSEPARHDLFAPNVGVAYRVTDKDVVRAAYGYSIAAIDISPLLFPENFSLNAAQTSWNYGQTGVHYSLSNPFPTANYPTGLNQPIPRSAFTPKTLVTQSVTAAVASPIVPTTQQWNLIIGHQFPHDLSIEVGYAGSSAKGLPISNNPGYALNELPSVYWNDRSIPQLTNSATASTTVSASQLALCTAVWGTTTYGQCARPYSSYQSYNDAYGPYGFVNYQSMPIRVQKRFRSGGLISGSYTWAKTLSNTGGSTGFGPGGGGNIQDYDNLAGEKSISSYSIPRRLVVSSVLPLPIGKDRAFLNHLTNPVADRVVSGWSVNGITTFQDGFPIGLGVNLPNGTADIPIQFGGGSLRPNYQYGCPKLAGGSWLSHVLAGTSVLNSNCWSAPPAAYSYNGTNYATTLGNEPRIDTVVKAPGQNNWDLTLQKQTKITETVNLEFRWEMFNAFNHVRFGAPSSSVGGNGFGTITGNSQGENEPRLDQLSLRLHF